MNKLEFTIDLKYDDTVENVISNIKLDGKKMNRYTFKEIAIYKEKQLDEENYTHKNEKLDNSYVLKADEIYSVYFKDLDLSSFDVELQNVGAITINGRSNEDIPFYSFNGEMNKTELLFVLGYPQGRAEVTTTAVEGENANNETLTTGNETTKETIAQEVVTTDPQVNSTKTYILIGIIVILVIIIGCLIYKLSKTNSEN